MAPREKIGGRNVTLYLDETEWSLFKAKLKAQNARTGETVTPSRLIRKWIFEHNRNKN